MKMRDNARIGRVMAHLTEIGIEHLAIGNRQSSKSGLASGDWDKPGTAGHDCHNAFVIYMIHVVNAPSPAATAALAIGPLLAERLLRSNVGGAAATPTA